jgi:steroid 5-alpha reductase family enzyme
MYPSNAVIISLYNTFNNGLNTLLFTLASSNPTWSPLSLYFGATLYTIGILVEPIAETQRMIFKDKPENQGRAYAGGLFGLARNINYGAYTAWRVGMALAAGGPLFGAFIGGMFVYDFANRAASILSRRLSQF